MNSLKIDEIQIEFEFEWKMKFLSRLEFEKFALVFLIKQASNVEFE